MSCKIVIYYTFIIFFVSASAYYIIEQPPNYFEQSSRDLDLNFSTDDSNRRESERFSKPYVQKVYTYRDSENPNVELGFGRPNSYYKISEIPPRQTGWTEALVVPERNRKLGKLNNSHKGEVILELRVTANNNDVV